MSEKSPEEIVETIARGVLKEGAPCGIPPESLVGRWAGDEIYLVGDYDDSGLFQESESSEYRNISQELVEVWNDFIEAKEMKLEYNPDCSCQMVEAKKG